LFITSLSYGIKKLNLNIILKRLLEIFMIILNKKRLIFILFAIVFSIFSYSLNLSQETQIVSSVPVSNHTIILDAGHGMPDGGAVGNDGTIESELNLDIVLKLQELLEASNCTVILTRSDENGIYNTDKETIRQKKVSDMENRVDIANNSNAEIFVSIHMNKLEQSKYSGWQTFFKNDDKTSKKIAENIQTSLNYFIKKENTRTIQSISGIYLTKNVQIPLVLIECGFLSNSDEEKLLQTEDYQNELAWSIYIGIMDYFN
jgi:N-acetylmuramoyl-L-alanine amidase